MPPIDDSSTVTGAQPAVGGRTTRAWSIPSTLTSVTYGSAPNTLSATIRCGIEVPTILYSDAVLGIASPFASSGLPYCLFHSSL